MKSVVVEIKDGFAAVLSDDGSIVKIKNKNYSMGDEIVMKNQKLHITKKLALSIASTVLIVLAGGTGTWAYYSPYSYVSLDVNPSIEYTLNRFDRVIKVESVNDDGQVILDNIDSLNNLTIEAAISKTVDEIKQEGYFTDETSTSETSSDANSTSVDQTDAVTTDVLETLNGGIVIAVSTENDNTSENLTVQLRETVENIVEDDVEIEVSSVGLERVKEAKALGVTPGKLNLVEKLIASSSNPDDIILEEWLNKSVKEIMKEIKNNKKTDSTEIKEEDTEEIESITSNDSDEDDDSNISEDKDDDKSSSSQQTSADVNKEQEKAEKKQEKAIKEQEQAEEQAEKEQEQAKEQAEKEQEKAEEEAEKEREKAIKEQEKEEEQAEKEQEQAIKEQEKEEKEQEKSKSDENKNHDTQEDENGEED